MHVIIIGSGPAGVSAALYARRGGADVTVISKGAGGLTTAEWVENYYGFAEPISGAELEQRGIAGAERLGVRFETDEVLAVLPVEEGRGFRLEAACRTYAADAVILAAGASRKTLSIPGLRDFEGRGVSYCAICDAFFYRGKKVAVIGAGDYALHEAEILRPHAAQLSLLTNGEEPSVAISDGIAVQTQKIVRIEGARRVQHIVFDDETGMDVDGIFMAIGTAGSMELARKLGVVLSDGKIAVGKHMETNVPGVYAAGDCTGGLLQIAKAVYEGAEAGLAAVQYLRKQ
ncbi:thioredoxin reductase [Selenomonas sp. oral taxon 126]|uniref:NAD(P)/FAD-dependent oxidoreductase n=1 Tax=Selenomonas sp. oral taxon 126 TaxID=712528 RepID=UPI0008078046|nr:NAD(P)/FAD-dependent oxidoreductase [Selenomonas sp. oral taxon 126]ANR71033.1 thioredoxin reductase [Selenomonas sp. oral taxon 126]